MKRRLKIGLIAIAVLCGLLVALTLPGLPWSINVRHWLSKVAVKSQIRIARWRGHNPKLASVSGRISAKRAYVEVLDSASGWASFADADGRFVVPDLIWYPGASYKLIVASDPYDVRYFTLKTPESSPANGLLDVGDVSMNEGCSVSLSGLPGVNSLSYLDYDSGNTKYYKDAFEKVTAGIDSDEQKIASLNGFVASKLNYEEGAADFDSARRTIERGSRYCGCLSIALAAIAEAGNYKTRIIHLSEGGSEAIAHSVVEVYYSDGWHLFDPTLGVFFMNNRGSVASYKELRFDSSLLSPYAFTNSPRTHELPDWLPRVYNSGFHHYFYFQKRNSCELWWPFKNEKRAAGVTSSNDGDGSTTLTVGSAATAAAGDSTHQRICRRCELEAELALASRRHPDGTENRVAVR